MNYILSLILSIFIVNCATLQTIPKSLEQDNPAIYSGFLTIWMEPSGLNDLIFYYDEMDGIYTYLIYGIDTPLSFVLDTILLPVTIPLAIGKRIYFSRSERNASLSYHWSKNRGYGNIKYAEKVCESLGMQLPTRQELEVAVSNRITDSWEEINKQSKENPVDLFAQKIGDPSKELETYGKIRCIRTGRSN